MESGRQALLPHRVDPGRRRVGHSRPDRLHAAAAPPRAGKRLGSRPGGARLLASPPGDERGVTDPGQVSAGVATRRIDLHCHPNTAEWFAAIGPYVEALRTYWNRPWEPLPEDQVMEELRSAGVEVLMVAFDTETVTGCPPCTNDYVAGLRDRHPDVVLNAWASVDPWKGADALREAEHAVNDLGLIGFHFHPTCGGFSVGDLRLRALFEKIK